MFKITVNNTISGDIVKSCDSIDSAMEFIKVCLDNGIACSIEIDDRLLCERCKCEISKMSSYTLCTPCLQKLIKEVQAIDAM